MEEIGTTKSQGIARKLSLPHLPHIIGRVTKALPGHRAQAQSDPLAQEKSDEILYLEISQSMETNGKNM